LIGRDEDMQMTRVPNTPSRPRIFRAMAARAVLLVGAAAGLAACQHTRLPASAIPRRRITASAIRSR
jgi:hypothetical protein